MTLSPRWWIVVACCLATAAKGIEPPPWVYRMPEVQAFNQGWAEFSLLMSLIRVGTLAFLLIGGVLGDIFGRKRLLLGGLLGLIVANVLSILSPGLTWFLVMRVISGAAGALIVPLSLTMLFLAFADDFRARTLAIAVYVSITTTASLSAGLVGQLMYTLFDWRATVVPSTLLAVAGWILIRRTTEESKVEQVHRFDVVGHASWAMIALSAMIGLTVSQVAGYFASVIVLAASLIVVLGVGFLWWWEFKTRDSLLSQSQVPRHALLVMIIYGVCMQLGFVGYVGLVRNVLIAVYDYGVVLAAIALAPLLLGMGLMTLFGASRLMYLQARTVMSGGLLALSAVITLTMTTQAAAFYPLLALLLTAFGAANLASVTAWTSLFFSVMPKDTIGVRTGISSSVFQSGGAIGGALTAGLLVIFGLTNYEARLLEAGVDPVQIDGALAVLNTVLNLAMADAGIDPAISEKLIEGYHLAYLAAYDQVLLIVAAICLVGAAVMWFGLPEKNRRTLTVAEGG